jgi:hypothetical protein
MEDKPTFEQIQADDEERLKDELWKESRHRNLSEIDTFWNGNPYATPIQRAGLVVFGLFAVILAVLFASIPSQKHFEEGWSFAFFIAFLLILGAGKLFLNASRRPKQSDRAKQSEEPGCGLSAELGEQEDDHL